MCGRVKLADMCVYDHNFVCIPAALVLVCLSFHQETMTVSTDSQPQHIYSTASVDMIFLFKLLISQKVLKEKEIRIYENMDGQMMICILPYTVISYHTIFFNYYMIS